MAVTLPTAERVLLGLFLCADKPNEILAALNPEWNEKVILPIEEKCYMRNAHPDGNRDSIHNLFPWKDECSEGLSIELFAASFLKQPDLFLRIRPGNERQVKMKLKNEAIDFTSVNNSCLVVSNNTKIDAILEIDKEVVIQDYSSQRVAEFFPINIDGTVKTVWDCCAASGGKSILAKDVMSNIHLTVSDVRENILFNLKKRFKAAGINNYKSFKADLADPKQTTPSAPFDLIIADVPCSGSGTWSRTPEQLYYFEPEKIDEYATLQRSILENVVKALKPGGYLLYITCSVFKKENEWQVDYIKEKFNLQKIRMELLKGYEMKADSMFAALLKLP